MERPAGQSKHQLNLPLQAAEGGGIPDDTQNELILTLMELLMAAVQAPPPSRHAGGADAREADR
jgi:hypothetical protein